MINELFHFAGQSPPQPAVAAAQRRRSSQFIMSELPGAKHAAGHRPPEQPQRGRPLLAGGQLTQQQQQQQQPNMAPWKVDISWYRKLFGRNGHNCGKSLGIFALETLGW